MRILYIFLLLVILLFIGVFGAEYTFLSNKNNITGTSTINTVENQAVFLKNGQVYFGKIQSVNQYYISLANIYYL